jgi:hypothetical protein
MKEAFKRLDALASELYESELSRTGGYYLVIASPEEDSSQCLNSVRGRSQDIIDGVLNMMVGDPRAAAIFTTAVMLFQEFTREERSKEQEPTEASGRMLN